MNNLDIPELVRKIRHQRGWSQERLAHEMGISFTTVSSWERGKRIPQPYLMRKLDELAGEVPQESIYTGGNDSI
jgi:transcriptional regulator with XRE-family HTH domain